MLRRRKEFNKLLKTICNNVYFQPPDNIRMKYPAIIYKVYLTEDEYANNNKYLGCTYYELTVVDRNPDSEVAMAVYRLPKSSFVREFKSDDLNHYIFRVYY